MNIRLQRLPDVIENAHQNTAQMLRLKEIRPII
jgi:hypothetical protein